MPVEMLSYNQLGERLGCSPEAARALVKRLRLPRQKANDGKVLVSVDLSEINHKPMPTRSPAGQHPITAALKARIEVLEAELAKLETLAAGHRGDFERERERFDGLMTEVLRATLDVQGAKEASPGFKANWLRCGPAHGGIRCLGASRERRPRNQPWQRSCAHHDLTRSSFWVTFQATSIAVGQSTGSFLLTIGGHRIWRCNLRTNCNLLSLFRGAVGKRSGAAAGDDVLGSSNGSVATAGF
jgi:hypothetical protein